MSERNLNTELKVGLFTVATLGVLALVAVVLEGNPFSSKSQEFYTELDNVGGVGPRTQVRTSGVQVGEVASIDILPKGARINFQVDGGVKIPKGSVLELRSRGVLGDVYLEIVRNENSAETYKSGDLIPKVSESNDMGALMQSLGSIARDIQNVSRSLASVLGNPDGQSSLKNVLENIEKVTADARDLIAGEKGNLSETIRSLHSTSTKLASLLERNDTRIENVLAGIDDTTRDMKAFAASLREFTTGENRDKIQGILAAVDDSMKSLQQTSGKVQLIVDKVDRGEGSLGQLVSKNDTAQELRNTLKSVQEILKPAARMKLEVDYKGELRSGESQSMGRAANHFNVRISTRPDRFYLLGVSDSPVARSVISTRTTTSTDGAITTENTVTETPEDRERLRWNLQFAKRFEAVGLRFGLFEGYAGFAGDLYLFSDRLQAAVEAFQFSSPAANARLQQDGGAVRVKTYANLFVTPNIYLTGGADNIGRRPKPFPYAGLGLRFTDDDLKAVVGAAALAK